MLAYFVASLILLIIGALYDVLWTAYIRAVGERKRVKASIYSASLAAVGYLVWFIMVWTGIEGTLLGVIAYSLGGGIGTYLTMGRDDGEEEKARTD